MTTRTDIHRPSEIVPDDYAYVACEHIKTEGDIGLCELQNEYRNIIRAHMASTGGTYSRHEHGGNCHVCGSVNLIYSILYYHAPSNSYIRVGEDCAQKLDMGGTREMSKFRAAMRDALEAQAGKRKARKILNDAGVEPIVWDIYEREQNFNRVPFAEGNRQRPYEEATIADIVGKVVKYGNISDAQVKFVNGLIDRIARRAEIAAQRAAENEAAAPCPTGRITIEGIVLSTKWVDSDFGGSLKMLVKAVSGFKVWCTVPSANEVGKGDHISFVVSVEPSRDDPKFGFGKRPAKLTMIQAAPVAA